MGTIFTKRKKQSLKNQQPKEQEVNLETQSQKTQQIPQIQKKIRTVMPFIHPRGQLKFRDISLNKKNAIEKSPVIFQLLNNEKWIIQPEIIEHLRIMNAFEYVQQSAAIALHLTLIRSGTHLINDNEKLQIARQKHEQRPQNEQISLYNEYAVIYADLFNIKFINLKKLKIKGPHREVSETIVSLEPLTRLYAPYLEQLVADGHPLTNARFLRRCQWPFLYKLSLKDNAIADSRELGQIISGLTNSCHLESVDLDGIFSHNWTEVGWITKLGYLDAQLEHKMLQNDENYYQRYNGRVLRRIDCSLIKKTLYTKHISMIRCKFNNIYFENPLSIW